MNLPCWFNAYQKQQAYALLMLGFKYAGTCSLDEQDPEQTDHYIYSNDEFFPLYHCHDWAFQFADGEPLLMAYSNGALFVIDLCDASNAVLNADDDIRFGAERMFLKSAIAALEYVIDFQKNELNLTYTQLTIC